MFEYTLFIVDTFNNETDAVFMDALDTFNNEHVHVEPFMFDALINETFSNETFPVFILMICAHAFVILNDITYPSCNFTCTILALSIQQFDILAFISSCVVLFCVTYVTL